MKFENFILSIPNFMPNDACDDIVKAFKITDLDPIKGWKENNNQTDRKDISLSGREVLRDLKATDENGQPLNAVSLFRETLNIGLSHYLDNVDMLKEKIENQIGYFNTDAYKWQKTLVGGGYHKWHYENTLEKRRELVWTLYLNDVEEGGETEFLYQHTRIKPEKGLFTIFPANWTHTHRGNPPISNEKYIGTGWYTFHYDELSMFNRGMEYNTLTLGQ
tara:strand:- start:48 stop:704 length:657 start_codon:yes stop_codon:yes gene_type:complete